MVPAIGTLNVRCGLAVGIMFQSLGDLHPTEWLSNDCPKSIVWIGLAFALD